MRVALVAMPWQVPFRPSAAIGLLCGFVQKHEPTIQVDCPYEYLNVTLKLGYCAYQLISLHAYDAGEVFYSSLLYPERKEGAEQWIAARLREAVVAADTQQSLPFPDSLYGDCDGDWVAIAQKIRHTLDLHLDEAAERMASQYDVIALTTTYYQLFASLAFAERVKKRSPQTKIILGGSTLSGMIGRTLMIEYPFLDYIVQGEGELPLLEILRHCKSAPEVLDRTKGLLTRNNLADLPGGATVWGIPKVDDLPLPNYDGYVEIARKMGNFWELPIEGSRGCWWDRVKKTGNVKDTCYFCSLNVVFDGYREKSVARLAHEVDTLTHNYGTGTVAFIDNIIRAKGGPELATKFGEMNRELEFLYEMRASTTPYEILTMWEVGLVSAQFGIEGLSTSYLKRIGKGTSAIQNLQAMKTIKELAIYHQGNLIVDFPGSTDEEVRDTCQVIENFTYAYQPLRIATFMVQAGTTVEALPEEFSIRNIRNADYYEVGLPSGVYQRLVLFDKSFDWSKKPANWGAVRLAIRRWTEMQQRGAESGRYLMDYMDGGKFLKLRYYNRGVYRERLLRGIEQELYLYCAEIKSLREISEKFSDRLSSAALDDILGFWFNETILFREGEKCLSLAPAMRPLYAAKRIRRAFLEREAEREQRGKRGEGHVGHGALLSRGFKTVPLEGDRAL